MTHKSLRKFERKLLVRALQREEFPWDYSYFKWQDMPVECGGNRFESLPVAGAPGFTAHWFLMDVCKSEARRMLQPERGRLPGSVEGKLLATKVIQGHRPANKAA